MPLTTSSVTSPEIDTPCTHASLIVTSVRSTPRKRAREKSTSMNSRPMRSSMRTVYRGLILTAGLVAKATGRSGLGEAVFIGRVRGGVGRDAGDAELGCLLHGFHR